MRPVWNGLWRTGATSDIILEIYQHITGCLLHWFDTYVRADDTIAAAPSPDIDRPIINTPEVPARPEARQPISNTNIPDAKTHVGRTVDPRCPKTS